MNSREERSRQYFDEDNEFLSGDPTTPDSWATDLKFAQVGVTGFQDQEQQFQQELLLEFDDEERTREAAIREQEVGHIVQSISDLNHIFKVNIVMRIVIKTNRKSFYVIALFVSFSFSFFRIYLTWCKTREVY